ncbi:unnamed protein product [Camellia sinensis]
MSSVSLSVSPGPSTLTSSTLISLSSLIHSLALESLAFRIVKTRNTTGLVVPAIDAGLGALTHTLGTLIPVIGASGFATAVAATVIGTVVGGFR